jgi:hypothetical protein
LCGRYHKCTCDCVLYVNSYEYIGDASIEVMSGKLTVVRICTRGNSVHNWRVKLCKCNSILLSVLTMQISTFEDTCHKLFPHILLAQLLNIIILLFTWVSLSKFIELIWMVWCHTSCIFSFSYKHCILCFRYYRYSIIKILSGFLKCKSHQNQLCF